MSCRSVRMTKLSFNSAPRKGSRFRSYALGTIIFLTLALGATHTFLHRTSVGSHRFIGMTFLVYTGTFLTTLSILILATILGRNLIKLYFEKRSGRPGSGFKTRLVRAFIVLSLLPALLLFVFSYTLINSSMGKWFQDPPAQILDSSRQLTRQYYADTEERAKFYAVSIAGRFQSLDESEDFQDRLREYSREYAIDAAQIFDANARLAAESGAAVSMPHHQTVRNEMIAKTLSGQDQFSFDSVTPNDTGHEIYYATAPIRDTEGCVIGVLLTETVRPRNLKFWADRMMDAADKYEQLQKEQTSLQFSMLLMLMLATLLIVFAFAWFALYLSKRVTVPIQALIEGAAAVSGGDLSHRVTCSAFDELESLVASFNRMTNDLQENEKRIEAARRSLQQTSAENADRRRYIETILQSISTGVIALDTDKNIRAMNQSAMRMLHVSQTGETEKIEDVLTPAAWKTLRSLLSKAALHGIGARNIEIVSLEKKSQLAANATPLTDASGCHTGWVIVLDDMTELLRMEKLSAWQEVARRMAHEIKNPLTPIRLSAERILKRYEQLSLPTDENAAPRNPRGIELAGNEAARFGRLLNECVRTIIQESDSLKNMVDEFSRFARLPEARFEDADLNRILENTLQRYDGRMTDVQILKELDPDIPKVKLDPEQMKRVFINLFDNALEAMVENTNRKTLRIRTSYDQSRGFAKVEIGDSGRGFPEEYQDSLFLPYFSTRKGGTGLGLAIARQIIAEHNGRVHAEANTPAGARIVISLPTEINSEFGIRNAEL